MNRISKASLQLFVYFLLYAPIFVVIGYSFNDSERSLRWRGFTTKWYVELFHDSSLITVALHSLLVGVLAATAATIIGTIAATALYKYRFRGRKILQAMIYLLIIVPDIVLAIALLMMYNTAHMPLGFWSLLFAHIAFCMPFAAVMISTRYQSLNPNLIEAAKDLGATDSVVFFKIILPLLAPALLSGWLLSFTLSLDDVLISFFVSGPSFEILPLRIFSMARHGVSPELNALCSMMLIVTLSTVLISQLLFGRKP